MPCLQKILPVLLLASICFSCGQTNRKKEQTTLKINIYPAFTEWADILLTKNDSLKSISIFLENQKSVGLKEDTFWFKKISLTNEQYRLLDSVLIKKTLNRADTSTSKVLDGIYIDAVLVDKGDTSNMFVQNPDNKRDSIAFAFTNSVFTVLPLIFKDSVATEYFKEMEGYSDESKLQKFSPSRKIDRMRMEKYHWSVRK